MLTASATPDTSKAQAAFAASLVSNFTPEAFHMWRRYLQTKGDTKAVASILLKSQRGADAGNAMALRGLKEESFREKQGILSVRVGRAVVLSS